MLIKELENYNLILASHSPRRAELLRGLNVNFTQTEMPNVDESYPSSMYKNKISGYIAEKKSYAYNKSLGNNDILITADTIVWCRGEIFGKPKDEEDARRMLCAISNNIHEVLTGVCLRSVSKIKTFTVCSMVKFRKLSNEEIDFYIKNYKPFDKAGAYGIQEWIGFVGLERIEGSYFNVMGLPLQKLYVELNHFIKK